MKYTNPIIRGFNPDPSICRVGEDYYLVVSSFEYFPGIPVYHSRDLVNWELIGSCIDRPEQLSQLAGTSSSGGIWAPTIRYHEGRFYVTATFDGVGNFIVSSKDPAGGWSEPVWTEFSGIDPSIFFEDGKMYYCANDLEDRRSIYGCEGISLAEMDPDSGKVHGEIKRIWNGAGGGWIEAPHIFHIGEYYYIIAAEGGTGGGHHEVLSRSRNIWGPYENCPRNPILTNRNDCSKQVWCSGHCDLVDDVNGNWWFVHLGTRPIAGAATLGRETFLMPVHWQDGWFEAVGRRSILECDVPLWNEQQIKSSWQAALCGEQWAKGWLFRRIPVKENYRQKEGELVLRTSSVRLSDSFGSPTFMAVRPLDMKYTFSVGFSFDPQEGGDAAGAVVYLNERFYCRIYKTRLNGLEHIVFERRIDGTDIVPFKAEAPSGEIKVRIESDGEEYRFYYFAAGKYVQAGSSTARLLSPETAGKCFTGAIPGVFAEGGGEAQLRIKSAEMQADI